MIRIGGVSFNTMQLYLIERREAWSIRCYQDEFKKYPFSVIDVFMSSGGHKILSVWVCDKDCFHMGLTKGNLPGNIFTDPCNHKDLLVRICQFEDNEDRNEELESFCYFGGEICQT
jgi:hypothetical protein